MFCQHCGATLDPQSSFCPQCGQQVNQNPTISEKRSSFWLKCILSILILSLCVIVLIALFSEDLTSSVEGQLSALKENKITEAYYDFVSKEFQKVTSLEKFREFINRYPLFSQTKSVRFINREVNDDVGTLNAILTTSNNVQIPVQYKLYKEEGKWKILSIRLEDLNSDNTEQEASKSTSSTEKTAIIDAVKNQLATFKHKELDKAYNDQTSQAFKKVTSLNEFKEFVDFNPLFETFTSIKINDPEVSGDLSKVEVELNGQNQTLALDYILSNDHSQWKVEGIQIKREPKQDTEEFDERPLFDVIQDQLKQIRKGNLANAYSHYTSKDFQKSTSLKDFESFVKEQSVFNSNLSARIEKLTFENNIAVITVRLESTNGDVYTAEYDLIVEDNQWKIMHIEAFPKKGNEPSK